VTEKISFDVLVRLPGPRMTVRELGVLRRAFPVLRSMAVAEAWDWARRHRRSAARPDEIYFEVGLRADAERAMRICREGGLSADLV
jgi:hypothetical protein